MKKILFILSLCFPVVLFGQVFLDKVQREIDSLNVFIADESTADTTLAESYLGLSGLLYVQNIDTMIPLCNKVIEIAEKKLATNPDKFEEIAMLNHYSGALNNIAFVYMSKGHINKCLNYLNKSLAIYEKTGNKQELATAIGNIGHVLQNQGNTPKALEYFQRSLNIEKEFGNNLNIGLSLSNIASIYSDQKNLDKALEYYQKSLSFIEKDGNEHFIAKVKLRIGGVLLDQGNTEVALNYYFNSLKLSTKLDAKQPISNCFEFLGDYHLNHNNLDSAFFYYKKSLEIRKDIDFKKGITISIIGIAKVLFKNGELLDAKKYALEALGFAQDLGYPREINTVAKLLSDIYEKENNNRAALEMLKLHIQMKDSITVQDSKKSLIQQQFKYEYETKKKEDDLQHELQIAVKDQKLKSEESFNKLLIVLLLLIAFFLIYIIERLYKINKQNKLIAHQKTLVEQKNKILERLSLVVSKTENVILILDANGNVEWVNDSFEKLNNLTYSQLIEERGKHIVDVSNQEGISDILTTCEKTKKPYRYDSLNITMDGDHVWESSTITPIYDVDEALSNFIIIDTDISKQKNAEELVVRKNKDITDSINYAKRLQNAILPNINSLTDNKLENFILYLPKGILSGDFYWIEKYAGKIYFAVADCTGHGVPGAMVSVICSSVLSKALLEEGLKEPASILNRARELVVQRFVNSEQEIRDGMDISLCALDLENNTLQWSGANNPLWIVRSGENTIEEVVADKQPIGMFITKEPFNNHTISINKGDNLYLFSDGFADQFGSKRGKKYKSTNLNKFILSIKDLSMEDQLKALHDEFYAWKGNFEQIDDVCVMGVRI
ncbi:MAG: tetratricopeptide repeat protein [Parvicellaceae bacterium]